MSARPDLLGLLPFADTADPDPNALPFADGPCRDAAECGHQECIAGSECEACGADAGEPCRPSCIGLAAHLDGLPLGDS